MLSATRAEVGRQVQLQITVTGTRKADRPEIPGVDGLQISFSGQTSQFQMENFRVTSSLVFTYLVLPLREGEFTIPSVEVQADGRNLETHPLQLLVEPAGQTATPGTEDNTETPPGVDDLIFAELLVPKEFAYVGEVIPVEIRLFVDRSARVQLDGPPQLAEDGFSVRRMASRRQQSVTRGEREFEMVVFQTAVTPLKAGPLTLGPCEIRTLVQIPERRRSRSPLDDFFGEDFFPGFPRARTQEVTVKTDPIPVAVRPLPQEGQPASFTGAVGQFQLNSEAPSRKGAVGDPLNLRVTLSGRGDFTRIGPPAIEAENWSAYPPSDRFDQDDELGISGRKTWEFSLVPEGPAPAFPSVEFSYFDPAREEYVTLQSDAIPADITGGPRPAHPAPLPPLDPQTSSTAEEIGRDILFILEQRSPPRGFTRVLARPEFWHAQVIPGVLAFAVAGLAWAARNRDDRARRERMQRRARAKELRAAIGAAEADDAEFFAAATRWLEHVAGENPDSLPGDLGAEAAWLAARRDAVRYSGQPGQPTDAAERARVMHFVTKVESLPEAGR